MKNVFTALALLLLATGVATAQDKPGKKAPEKATIARKASKPAQCKQDSTCNKTQAKKSCCMQPSRTAGLRTKKM